LVATVGPGSFRRARLCRQVTVVHRASRGAGSSALPPATGSGPSDSSSVTRPAQPDPNGSAETAVSRTGWRAGRGTAAGSSANPSLTRSSVPAATSGVFAGGRSEEGGNAWARRRDPGGIRRPWAGNVLASRSKGWTGQSNRRRRVKEVQYRGCVALGPFGPDPGSHTWKALGRPRPFELLET